MKAKEFLTMQNVDYSNLELIWDSCKKLDLDQYMSRFYPEINQTILWYLILLDSNVIGHVWVEKFNQNNNGNKLGIVIWKKTKRGIGIGYCAINKVIKSAKLNSNISKIVLNVRRSNQRAINCYKKVGFIEINEVLTYNSDKLIPFIQMCYEL